jgi:hypothetical protein
MLTGYGDAEPNQDWGMHGGIDIFVDGQGGQAVRAARSGTVVINNNYSGGYVVVRVPIGGGNFEYDGYMHVMNRAAPAVGNAIAEGALIGQISNTHYRAGRRHLHFEVQSALPPTNNKPDFHNYRDPFLRFTNIADRDPLGFIPSMFASTVANRNAWRTLTIAANNTTAPLGVATGDIDIIADVRDRMNDLNYIGASAPQSVGYYIRPLFANTHGVKDANQPYLITKLDDKWFANLPRTAAGAHAIADLIWPNNANMQVSPNPTGWPAILNTIVTNTAGTDGSPGNVWDEYWRTNARDDGSADTVDVANFYQRPLTNNNAQARFKDGDYEIHIVMGDVLTNVDSAAGRVRVANFARGAAPVMGAGAAAPPVGVATPLQTVASDTPWIVDYHPTPTDASVAAAFNVGDMVAVGGPGDTNYYPNELMNVFIEPHRIWNEGDSLSAYAVHQSLVMSDGTGTLPQTQAWLADHPGTYDLIVDYDNDSKFSWKLDGISSFVVMNPVAVTDSSQTVAEDDSYSTLHDHALTVSAPGVLANDSNSQNLPLTASPLSGPSNGTLALNSDGSFTYTPNSHFVGYDSFTYTATASDGSSATATVLIHVTHTPPSAADDAYTVQHNQSLTVPAASGVLANDSDADGDPITARLVVGPGNGSVTLNADGSFTYTPDPGFAGQDSFAYVANDGAADSPPATVTINVTNRLPVGQPDSYTVMHDQSLTVAATTGVLANDSDPDGDPITAVLLSGPSHGTLTLNPDGSFTYIPDPGFVGIDSFSYAPDDGTYSGDDYYGASPVQVTISVTDTTTVSLTTSLNPSPYTQPVTFTATVMPAAGLSGTPTGQVDFYADGVLIGSVTLSNGVASLSISTLSIGDHTITAFYEGDSLFASNFSDPLTQHVADNGNG